MPTPEKEQLVAEVAEKIQQAEACYLLSFTGLSVTEMNDLRGQVLAAGGRLQVVKNRLLKLALASQASEGLIEHLTGPTVIAYCEKEPIAPAQALAKFAADHEGLVFKAGFVEGNVIGAEEALRVAKLPPRQQILAEALAGISSPVSSLVGLLNAVVSELVYVLEAAVEKQQATSEAA